MNWVVPIGLAAFAASLLLTGLLRTYAVRRGLIDRPSERSSHNAPTPRGGGLSIPVVSLLFAMAGLGFGLRPDGAGGWVAGAALVMLVGFWDDHGHVSAASRMVVHMVAAVLGVMAVADLLGTGWTAIIVGVALVFMVVWAINLYNFMDGSDGLAALHAVLGAGFLAAVLLRAGHPLLGGMALILACAAAGFLPWNLPTARIFMGDGGSGFLGYALAGLVMNAAYRTDVGLVTLLLPFGYFVFDATVTLLRRLLRAERVYEAHRHHAYQRALRMGLGHRGVLLGGAVIQLLLIGLATGAHMHAWSAGAAAAGGALALAFVYALVEWGAPMGSP
jgi:Fuc2NAc and GlcNAc transferase